MDVLIQDEVPGAARLPVLRLPVATPTITAAALIRARVELELERQREAAQAGTDLPAGALVMPAGRNGPSKAEHKADRTVATALDAFARGGFFLLVGDRQVESLDEEIALTEATEVVFLRLVPLQGG